MATNKLNTGIYIHPSGRQSDYFDAPSEFVRPILYCVLFPSSHRGFPHWCQRPASAEALLHAFIWWPYLPVLILFNPRVRKEFSIFISHHGDSCACFLCCELCAYYV
jgi:hypothetical protein